MGNIANLDIVAGLLSGLFLISSWITPISIILRPIFFIIDSFIYTLVPLAYEFCKILASVQFIVNQQEILDNVARGIYSLLAVIMLFKLAFSLLALMTDPDKIEDKEKGTAKVFTNVIVCLILIIAVPMIFRFAASAQDAILGVQRNETGAITGTETGMIEKIFFKNGDDSWCPESSRTGQTVCPSLGTFLSNSIFQVFFTFTPSTLADRGMQYGIDITGEVKTIQDVYNQTFNLPFPFYFNLLPYINTPTLYEITVNLPVLGEQHIPSNYIYVFGYFFLFSTIAGIYLLWIFVSLALDIGYRSIKLFALQLIAPIPIISYMDSNSQTKGVFKKWVDEVVKTYLSLFIRIAVLSIAAVIVKSVDWSAPTYRGQDLVTLWGLLLPFTKLFFFLGILTFMKTAPKMFENIFGYAGKTKEESFGQNLVKGLMGGVAAGAVGAVSGGLSAKAHGYSGFMGAALGGIDSLKAGGKAGFAGKFGDLGKAVIGGPAAVGKALNYKTGILENWRTKSLNARERGLDKKFAGIRDDKGFIAYEKGLASQVAGTFDNEGTYLSHLATRGRAGTEELAYYNSLADAEERAKRRKVYGKEVGKAYATPLADQRFKDEILKKDPKAIARYEKMQAPAREAYRKNYGKIQAYSSMLGKVDVELNSRVQQVIEKDQEILMDEAEVTNLNDKYNSLASEYSAILTARGGDKTDPDVVAANGRVTAAKGERDAKQGDITANKIKKGKLEKALEYMVSKDPNHAAGASVYNQIEQGGFSNVD